MADKTGDRLIEVNFMIRDERADFDIEFDPTPFYFCKKLIFRAIDLKKEKGWGGAGGVLEGSWEKAPVATRWI